MGFLYTWLVFPVLFIVLIFLSESKGYFHIIIQSGWLYFLNHYTVKIKWIYETKCIFSTNFSKVNARAVVFEDKAEMWLSRSLTL